MPPSHEAWDIIWRSYTSVKLTKCVEIGRSYCNVGFVKSFGERCEVHTVVHICIVCYSFLYQLMCDLEHLIDRML